MSVDHLLSLAQLLLLPMVGLLWRIDTRLAAVAATQGDHDRRLDRLERQQA